MELGYQTIHHHHYQRSVVTDQPLLAHLPTALSELNTAITENSLLQITQQKLNLANI